MLVILKYSNGISFLSKIDLYVNFILIEFLGRWYEQYSKLVFFKVQFPTLIFGN